MTLAMKKSDSDFVIRDYQEQAAWAPLRHWEKHNTWPIIVAPTGSGKSVILARFIKIAHDMYPDTRFIVLSHVAELLKQNASAILTQWPTCNLSFYSDKLKSKNSSGQVVLASIQSYYKQAYNSGLPAPELVIIDECHLLNEKDGSMYRKFLSDMALVNPYIKCIGLSATPFRSGTGYLHKGKNALFGHICYEIGILDLINRGFLVPVVTPKMNTKLNTSGVKVQGGDYVQSQLEKAVNTDPQVKACVDETMAHSENRKRWLIFTAGIEHCEHVRDEIRSRGVACEMVHGKTPTEERNRIIAWHKERTNDPRCLVNVAVLNTGYDNPPIDLLGLLRPTRSPVLYIQTVGRGMRTAPGKSDCLLLDFGSVVETLGPIDQIRLPEKRKGDGEAPTKICPNCGELSHAAVRICTACAHEFPEPELHLDKKASTAAALSTQLKTETRPVSRVSYYRHQKEGRPDSLRVDYLCGINTHRLWVCLEHSGNPRMHACKWWKEMAGTNPPNSITEALNRISELRKPESIEVKKVGKYFEVVGVNV